MRIYRACKDVRKKLGNLMILMLLVGGLMGCGMHDDPSERGESEGGVASEGLSYETRVLDPLLPGFAPHRQAQPAAVELGRAVLCSPEGDCRDLRELQPWCGLEGGCEDRCELDGPASAQALDAGCVCQPVNQGRETCDGVDEDCDGVVDNIYAGGHLSARGDLTCVTSRAGALRCMGSGPAAGYWPPSPARLGQVSAGREHGCGLGADAQVYCWGDNFYGQALPGGPAQVDVPTRVELAEDILQVGSGAYFSCALTQTGRIYCWGRNQYSQLGDGTSVPHDGPIEIAAELDFVNLSLGAGHACALTRDGRVLCWGANHFGQAAQPDMRTINVPSWVHIPDRVSQISAGKLHTCAVTDYERVYCWGNNEYGQLGDETTITRRTPQVAGEELLLGSVTAGGMRTCGLSSAGRVYCWGDNTRGSLGIDGAQPLYTLPTAAAGTLEFVEIQAGDAHTCGLTRNGYLLCWGRGQEGQLGEGVRSQIRQPRHADCP